jgi:putative MATE family efflux protein
MARDLTKGSIPELLIKLALPAVFSLLGYTVNYFIDGIWIGRLGPKSLAALAPASFVLWIIYSFMDIMAIGIVAVISRYYGEKNFDKASETSQKVVQFTAILSIVFLFAVLVLSKYIFLFVGVSSEVVNRGQIYLMVMAFAMPAFFIGEVFYGIFRASGDTTTPMKLTMAFVGCNIVLDPLLIFGVGPLPRLELAGAALASVIGHYLALVWAFYKIRKGGIPFKVFARKILPFDFSLIWKVARVGIPISMSGLVFSIVYIILSRVAAPYGDFVVASFRVGQLVESVSFMVCFGFSQAAASMVGQNLGARLPKRAEKSAWIAIAIISTITFCFSFLFYFFARPITSLFTNDPQMMTSAVYYLKIVALAQVMMGFEIVLEGVFSGAGDTVPPMIVSIVGTAIRIPLAIVFANMLGFGYTGIYWAITASTIIKGVAIFIWFSVGKWKLKKI